jgi:hypothetical protein
LADKVVIDAIGQTVEDLKIISNLRLQWKKLAVKPASGELGFLHIAKQANVLAVPLSFDFIKKKM